MNADFPEFDDFNANENGLKLQSELKNTGKKTLVLFMNGYLDNENASAFLNTISNVLKRINNLQRLVFNLAMLNYISSTGIGAFVTILKQSTETNMEFILCSINQKVFSILESLGFSQFFTIAEKYEDV